MAKELSGFYTPGTTGIYAILYKNAQVYNGSTYEDFLTANWGTYDIPLTEDSTTGFYAANMPAAQSAGDYEYILYLETSPGTPAPTDARISGVGAFSWDGSAIISSRTIKTDTAAILEDTGTTLPATLAAIQGSTFDTSTDSLEAIRNRGDAAWTTATGFSTLTASDIRDAVGLASANLDTQLSTIDNVVDSILDDTGTSGVVVAAASKTGYTLAAAGLDSVTIETGLNARQSLSLIASAIGGVLAGADTTTITIAAAGVPATNRITVTVDADGNRSAIILNLPS